MEISCDIIVLLKKPSAPFQVHQHSLSTIIDHKQLHIGSSIMQFHTCTLAFIIGFAPLISAQDLSIPPQFPPCAVRKFSSLIVCQTTRTYELISLSSHLDTMRYQFASTFGMYSVRCHVHLQKSDFCRRSPTV